MEDLHQSFLKTLNNMIEANPAQAEEIDIEQLIADVTPEVVDLIKSTLQKSAKKMLKEHRTLASGFEKRKAKSSSKCTT